MAFRISENLGNKSSKYIFGYLMVFFKRNMFPCGLLYLCLNRLKRTFLIFCQLE